MAKTLTLTDIKIIAWRVDVEQKRVVAAYQVLRDDGSVQETAEAIYWATMPPPTMGEDGEELSRPENWYQLPAKYVSILTNLTIDLRAALLHIVNA